MKKFKYIFFDWDGCLAQSLDIWLNGYKMAFKNIDVAVSEEDIIQHFGEWELAKHFGVKDVEAFNNSLLQFIDANLKKAPLNKGAKELIKELFGTKKLAILSSSNREFLHSAMRYNNILEYFEIILSAEDVINHKPHPEIIEKAVAHFRAHKDEVVMIGDTRKDIEAANHAGVSSILVYPEEHKMYYDLNELKKSKPTHIVSDLLEIVDVLG